MAHQGCRANDDDDDNDVVTNYNFTLTVLGSKPGHDKYYPNEQNHGFP
jgi:hypothetical protein